jgi:hypothetical protein
MSKVIIKLKEEFLELLPPAIFFFIALHIVAFVRSLMLKGTGISPFSSLSVTIVALILAKAVLLADLLPAINRFPHRPLIYNIAWKTVIYMVMATMLHFLEHLIEFWRKTGSVVEGAKRLIAEIIWPHFVAIQIILFMLVIMYVTIHEFVRLIGREKTLQILFGQMPLRQT